MKAAELESYVARHPALRTAAAKPYGRALMWALEFNHGEAALALIRTGAAPKAAKPGESGPLHIAARGGLDAVVAELLARGASAKAASYWGTPLHFAAKQGHASTMKLLLAAGADPSAQARDHQFTPLHGAVIERHLDAIVVLITAKADLEAKDDDGRTPLHWGGFAYVPQAVHRYAKIGEPHDTTFHDPGPAVGMKLLLDAGARVDAVDARGNTPLHAAAEVGSLRGVEILLARGARAGVRNRAGQTALDLAMKRGDADIVQLLSMMGP
ncbi:MAG: ankyrin repeat domain-containing protein [Deltaproteobacteria bacterium]|nr:ankyrin repeat domain-containing protein [Deltaproteobacteria bacterium]